MPTGERTDPSFLNRHKYISGWNRSSKVSDETCHVIYVNMLITH